MRRMKSKYLSGICKLIYLITVILIFIVNKRNIQLPKITLILLVGINMFSFAANIFLSEISKKLKIGIILSLVIFYVIFVILIWFNSKLKYSYRNISKFSLNLLQQQVNENFFVLNLEKKHLY